jgi:peptidoglycan L-alanyl-D-glutamate endopeptidase CwlK
MASTKIEDLTHDTQERVKMLTDLAAAEGIGIHPISTKRSCAEQDAIYAQGRTAPGAIVSGAAGCKSWHVWGRAIDLLAVRDGKVVGNTGDPVYDWLGAQAEKIGMVWGGKFSWGRDAPHFEYHPGVKISEVCPDPSQCSWSIKQDYPGPDVPPDQTPPPSPGGDGTQDVVYGVPPVDNKNTKVLVALLAGAAALGAGYVALRAYQSSNKQAAKNPATRAERNPTPQEKLAMRQAQELSGIAHAMFKPGEIKNVTISWSQYGGYTFRYHEGAWWLGEDPESAKHRLHDIVSQDLHLERAVRPEFRTAANPSSTCRAH